MLLIVSISMNVSPFTVEFSIEFDCQHKFILFCSKFKIEYVNLQDVICKKLSKMYCYY